MNILFFYFRAIVPTRGGIERVTSILADYFETQKQDVFYLSTSEINADEAHLSRQFFLPYPEKADAEENFDFYKKFLLEKKIDIVIFQGGHEKFPWRKFDGHPPLICCLHLDPSAYSTIVRDKAVFKLRTFPPLKRTLISPIWKTVVVFSKIALRRLKKQKVYRWNYEQCDKFVILSESYRNTLLSHLSNKDREKKIECISNPCSYEISEEHLKKEKILLFVGRLSLNQKRPDLMLEIWGKLATQFPDWRLEILGAGDDEKQVKELALEKKIPRVYFRGFISPESHFKKAPILCMTSSNEGFGMVLLEASAFGCIPVAFDTFPAVRDILKDGKNGYLIPPLNVDAYAQKLYSLMSGNLPENLVASCKENARRYSIAHVGKKWIRLFEEITNLSKDRLFHHFPAKAFRSMRRRCDAESSGNSQ